MKPSFFILFVFLILFFAGCEGERSENTAQIKKGKKELIVGVWTRPISGWKTGQMEGMNIKADGTFSLIGIYTMKGLNWQIRGDTLRLTTNTGRYPQPFESLFRIRELTDSTLVLDTAGGYLGGSYRRQTIGRVKGTVTYRELITLPENAEIRITLIEIFPPSDSVKIISEKRIKSAGRQVPIPFQIEYDPAIIDYTHTCAVRAIISFNGNPRFTSEKPYPVITRGYPDSVEVVVNRLK